MRIISFLSFLLFACSPNPDANAQKKASSHKEKSPIENIVDIYWMTAQERESTNPKKQGFAFRSANSLKGFDGCNTFHGGFTYTEKEGIKMKNLIATELKCPSDKQLFETSVFYGVKSLEVKGGELIFYNAQKKEIARFVSFTNPDKKDLPLPAGEWKMVESNHEHFKTVQKAGCEPYLRLKQDRSFVICYQKDKSKGWTEVNYFAGICQADAKRLFFEVDATASVLSVDMPEGEDSQLAHALKDVHLWEEKEGKLIFKYDKLNELYFVFEKLKK
jgi:heat shock protein HslJ